MAAIHVKGITLWKTYCRFSKLLHLNISTKHFSKHQALSVVLKHNVEKVEEISNDIQVSQYLRPLMNSSVEDILSIVNNKYIFPNQSVTLLKALRMHIIFKKTNPNNFNRDERFRKLCSIFHVNCKNMHPALLLSGLRSVLEVGVHPESECIKRVEQQIVENINLFSTNNLIRCLNFHQKYMQTDLQKLVNSTLMNEIVDRPFSQEDISHGSDVLMLLQVVHLFIGQSKFSLEKKIIEFISLLNVQELCKVVSILSEKGNRNKHILNAVSLQFRQNIMKPDIKEVIDVLYGMKTLNFCDENLFSYLLNTQTSEISTIKEPSLISRLLTICGHLKWKHSGVLYACSDWIMNNITICGTREFVAFILTSAALNYPPSKFEKTFKTILPFLSHQKIKSPDIWLDVVWSLAILNNVEQQMLQEVLSASFYQPLIDGSNFQAVNNKLKLMNLKGVMKEKYPECIFGCDLNLEPIEIMQSLEKENARRLVIQALCNIVPKGKLCLNQSTDMGIFIDAEFIMSKDTKPLSLSDYGVLENTLDSMKPLPKDAKRFALLLLFYKDFTLNEPSLTGVNALASRLLTDKGYVVVQVAFDEFVKNPTEVKRTRYLLDKINDAMMN